MKQLFINYADAIIDDVSINGVPVTNLTFPKINVYKAAQAILEIAKPGHQAGLGYQLAGSARSGLRCFWGWTSWFCCILLPQPQPRIPAQKTNQTPTPKNPNPSPNTANPTKNKNFTPIQKLQTLAAKLQTLVGKPRTPVPKPPTTAPKPRNPVPKPQTPASESRSPAPRPQIRAQKKPWWPKLS